MNINNLAAALKVTATLFGCCNNLEAIFNIIILHIIIILLRQQDEKRKCFVVIM